MKTQLPPEGLTAATRTTGPASMTAYWLRVQQRLPGRAIVAATGGLVAAGAVFQASVFVATVLVARALGQAELGRYAVANAVGSVIVSGLGGGLPVLALRETAASGLSRAFLRRVVEVELMVTGGATAIAATVGAIVLGGRRGAVLGLLAGIAYVALSEMSLLAAVHAGLERYRAAAGARIACGLMTVVLTVGALAAGLGIGGALVALSIAGSAAATWLAWTAREMASDSDGPDSAHLFARSRSLLGIGLIYGGYQRIDALVVLVVTTASTAGIYAAAYRILSPFALMASGFGTVFLSRLSSMGAVSATWHSVRRRGTVLFALTILPLAVVAWLGMPQLVRLFYGAKFEGAAGPARVLVLSLLPYAFYLPNAHALNAARRERSLLAVLAISALLEVVLMMVLAPSYGAGGAAWAWVATECWTLLGVFWLLRRLEPGLPESGAVADGPSETPRTPDKVHDR